MADTVIANLPTLAHANGGEDVNLVRDEKGRLLVRADNQGGYDCTYVDVALLLIELNRLTREGVLIETR